MQRQHVVEERGRRWVDGTLPSEEYFRAARREARDRARKLVADRLARARSPLVPGRPVTSSR